MRQDQLIQIPFKVVALALAEAHHMGKAGDEPGKRFHAESATQALLADLAKAGATICPIDCYRPEDRKVEEAETYRVRVGWPEFKIVELTLAPGTDVATVTRAAKKHLLPRPRSNHASWPAYSWEEDRFLAPDEPAPLTFIVGPHKALMDREGSATGYFPALMALRTRTVNAAEVGEALGRASPDGSEGNIWALYDARQRTRGQVSAVDLDLDLKPGEPDGTFFLRPARILGVMYSDGIISFAGDASDLVAFRDMAAKVVGLPGAREVAMTPAPLEFRVGGIPVKAFCTPEERDELKAKLEALCCFPHERSST